MAYNYLKGFRIAVIICVFLQVFLICGCNVLESVENEIPNNTDINSTEAPLQEFLATPQNQTVSVGSFAKFVCIVSHKSGNLRWTKDFKGLGNLSSHPHYAIVGDKRIGEFSLLIKNVTIEDEGLYGCQVSPGTAEEDFGLFSYVYLTVEGPPDPPIITLESYYPASGHGHAFESQFIILKCVSLYGKPPPEVTWLDTKGQKVPDTEVKTKYLRNYPNFAGENLDIGNNTRATISFYTVKVFKEDNGKKISCQIRSKMTLHKFPLSPISTFIQLNISFPPQITLRFEIKSPTTEPTHYLEHSWVDPGIREMDLVKLVCRGSANPPAEFSWLINNERVEILRQKKYGIIGTRIIEDRQQQISTLLLPNVTRRLHDSIVKCVAHNWAGSSTVSKTLYIKAGIQDPVKPETNSGAVQLGIKIGVGLGISAVIIAFVGICTYCRSRDSRAHSDDVQVPLQDLLQGPIDLGSSLRSDSDATLTRQPKPKIEGVADAPVPETNFSET